MTRRALVVLLAAGCVRDVAPRPCASQEDCGEGFRCDLSKLVDGGGRCALGESCEGTDADDDDYCAEEGDAQSCCPLGASDCDDSDPGVNPGATEMTGNDVDEDCDGVASDQDDDGHNAPGDGSGGREPDDCCDTDPRAYPGQSDWFTADDGEVACEEGGWDYNCNTSREIQLSGTASCGCSALICSGTDGWRGADPVCGGTGMYATCAVLSCGGCAAGGSTRPQGCH